MVGAGLTRAVTGSKLLVQGPELNLTGRLLVGEAVARFDLFDELRRRSDSHRLNDREPIPPGLHHRQCVKRQSGTVVRLIMLKTKHEAAVPTHRGSPQSLSHSDLGQSQEPQGRLTILILIWG